MKNFKIVKKGFAIVSQNNKMILRVTPSNKKEICMLDETDKQIAIWNTQKMAEKVFFIEELYVENMKTMSFVKNGIYPGLGNVDDITWELAQKELNISEKIAFSKSATNYIETVYPQLAENITWFNLKHLFEIKEISSEITKNLDENALLNEIGFMIVDETEQFILKGTPQNRSKVLINEKNNQRLMIYPNENRAKFGLEITNNCYFSELAADFIEQNNLSPVWKIEKFNIAYKLGKI